MRKSESIPDPEAQQMEHYINRNDSSQGKHPGIRKECTICNPTEWSMLSSEQIEAIIDKYTG